MGHSLGDEIWTLWLLLCEGQKDTRKKQLTPVTRPRAWHRTEG